MEHLKQKASPWDDPLRIHVPPWAITATDHVPPHVPANAGDDHLSTRWTANGEFQWIEFDLLSVEFVTKTVIISG